jgi:hypothetical protein
MNELLTALVLAAMAIGIGVILYIAFVCIVLLASLVSRKKE